MNNFPEFMRNPVNAIIEQDQQQGIEGYMYEGNDGSQVVIWICNIDGRSEHDTHDFDEYMFVVSGEYTITIDNTGTTLQPGDEYYIPQGTPHSGSFTRGTRTIHAFGGKRASLLDPSASNRE